MVLFVKYDKKMWTFSKLEPEKFNQHSGISD